MFEFLSLHLISSFPVFRYKAHLLKHIQLKLPRRLLCKQHQNSQHRVVVELPLCTSFCPTGMFVSGSNVGVFIIFCSSTSVATASSTNRSLYKNDFKETSLFLRKVKKPVAIEYNFTKRDLCEAPYDITTTLSLVLLKGAFTSASKHQSGLLILLLVSR